MWQRCPRAAQRSFAELEIATALCFDRAIVFLSLIQELVMTIRAIAVVLVSLVCIWSLTVPDSVLAQASTRDPCANACACDFECTDFCSTESCNRPSICKRRVEGLVKACKKGCDRCQKLHKSKKS
jgi:hypothetical protein